MPETTIFVSSGFGLNRGPFVTLGVHGREIQMSVEEARHHAMATLQAAEAAESDGMIVEFLLKRLGMTMEHGAAVLIELRKIREAKQRERLGVV
jgi:hypothetical protein